MLQVLENDIVRLMVVSVFQIVLCYPMKNIQSVQFKLWYSIVLGTILQVIVYGRDAFYILVFSISMYLLTLVLPLKQVGWAVTTISIIFLSYYHLESLIYRYGEYVFDETVLLMIMVCKCSLYAYSWQDGQLKLQNIKKENGLQNISQRENEKEKQREKYFITSRVNLLDYMGYIQFLPTSIMGPPIQYKIYQKYIKNQGQFGQPLPSRRQKIISTVKQFVICFILFVIGTMYFSPDFVKTEQFYSYNRLYMFFYTVIASTLLRFKYYSGWKIGIASIHASGVSYDAKTKDYSAIEHCRPLIIETSSTIRDKINNWNVMVQDWFRKCIYDRTSFKSTFARQLLVFMVSAFWHGFYLGYYISFFFWFAQVYLEAQLYKLSKEKIKSKPQKQNEAEVNGQKKKRISSKIKNILKIMIVSIIFSHNAIFFSLLSWKQCLRLLKQMYFIPQMLIIFGIIYLSFRKKSVKSKKIVSSEKESTKKSQSQTQTQKKTA